MSLPAKGPKAYLEAKASSGGLWVRGTKCHIGELAPLYQQNGIPCRIEPGPSPDEDVLRFDEPVDRANMEAILKAYQDAKGS